MRIRHSRTRLALLTVVAPTRVRYSGGGHDVVNPVFMRAAPSLPPSDPPRVVHGDRHNRERDADLRGPNSLDAMRCREMSVVSTRAGRARGGGMVVSGGLTLHGVTRPAQIH